MTQKLALIDMDNTLADYQLGIAINPNRKQSGWWLNLKPLKRGFDLLYLCRDLGFKIHVATKGPVKESAAWSEKVSWFKKHVKPACPDAKITITEDKTLIRGDILIDDWPAYMDGWLDKNLAGFGIMPSWPWNKNYSRSRCFCYENSRNIHTVKFLLKEVIDAS